VQVEGGDGYNCYWPMPFHQRGLITVTNEGQKNVRSFYYHIDYTLEENLPEKTGYFCAQYRNEFPENMGNDYLILDAEGEGHYVGTVMSVRSRSPFWFGEGDAKFYVDGEEKPTIWGTGTEDYFLMAWGLSERQFPYFGCTYMSADFEDLGVEYCLYRWHIADPVRFTQSLRFEIEHTGWITADETESGEIEFDFYMKDIEVKDIYLGSFQLAEGKHLLRFGCVGKNPLSSGNYLGLDSIRLRERWNKKRPALWKL
jgi:hypothetical protein